MPENVVPFNQDHTLLDDVALPATLRGYFSRLIGDTIPNNPKLNTRRVFQNTPYTPRTAIEASTGYIVKMNFPPNTPRRLFVYLKYLADGEGDGEGGGGELRHFIVPDDQLAPVLSTWLQSKVTDGVCSIDQDRPITQLFPNGQRVSLYH